MQVILTVSQIMWCADLSRILKDGDECLLALQRFEESSFQNLKNLAALLRGSLPKITRNVINALLTIDVHARDIVRNMIKTKVIGIVFRIIIFVFFIFFVPYKDV